MIESKDGVISTINEDVMHMAYQEIGPDGEMAWVNCTTPYHLHSRADGEWLTCGEAAKFAQNRMMGRQVLKNRDETKKGDGQVHLPRPLNLAE